MDLADVVKMLEILGSDHDPIWRGGHETTPAELAVIADSATEPDRLRIQFWGSRGDQERKRSGTLVTMVLDRIAMARKREAGR